MIATANALLEATQQSIFDDEAMEVAQFITHTHNELDNDQVAKALFMYASNKTHPAVFSKMVNDFAEMFAKDNPNFDVVKFHEEANYRVPKFTTN